VKELWKGREEEEKEFSTSWVTLKIREGTAI
jgi:hypothetical protein